MPRRRVHTRYRDVCQRQEAHSLEHQVEHLSHLNHSKTPGSSWRLKLSKSPDTVTWPPRGLDPISYYRSRITVNVHIRAGGGDKIEVVRVCRKKLSTHPCLKGCQPFSAPGAETLVQLRQARLSAAPPTVDRDYRKQTDNDIQLKPNPRGCPKRACFPS